MDHFELTKAASALAIFLVGLFAGLVPWTLGRSPGSTRLITLGNCFAGGVLLGAGIIHLLGDAIGGFDSLYPDSDFPWPLAICATSFLLILMIERVIPRITEDDIEGDPEAAALIIGMSEKKVFPYLLLLTLSIHSFIAGLALGTQTAAAGFWVVLIAIMAHKGSAAFSLGVSMYRADFKRPLAGRMIASFAFMTPLGVLAGIGLGVIFSGPSEQVFEAYFDAIAAGTFLYIATLDILREEFIPTHKDRISRFAAAFTGLLVMAVVAIWA